MRLKFFVAASAALAAAGCEMQSASFAIEDEGIGAPASFVVEGNPTCAELFPGTFELKIEPVVSGTYAVPGMDANVEISTDGTHLSFEASIGMTAVLMKGGPRANVYHYEPPATSDEGLVSPDNASGEPAAISHVSFCYEFAVEVAKTAHTRFTRTHAWEIGKDGDETELLMRPGQHHEVNYVVTLSQAFEDSAYAVQGEITVRNPAPVAATLESVTDTFLGEAIPVDCGVSFPHELAAGETLVCTYAAELDAPVSGDNIAVVETSGAVNGGAATAAVDFDAADVDAVDACVDVDDSLVGALGTVCVGDDPATFEYDYIVSVTDAHCEGLVVENIASFVASDSGATGEASHLVEVEVACETGCTLTQGYWKTHSSYGPAKKTDETWDLVGGPDAPFFLSGQSYYEVLWTAPRGNAYYNLAVQYIAAELNLLAGAASGDVTDELAQATELLETYTPAEVGALSGQEGRALRGLILSIAATLDAYNNGLIGPGHCSEK
jgi:hypothetical protein